MLKSKHYELSYLQEKQACIKDIHIDRINQVIGGLVCLFPVDKETFPTISAPYAFKCICGGYVVMDYSSVCTGKNKSCGCYKKRRGYLQTVFNSLYKSYSSNYEVVKLGSHVRSRDWGIRCRVCGVETEKGTAHEHIYQGRRFCKCSACYQAPYDEIKQSCYKAIIGTKWEIISFPDKYKSKRELRILLRCKECGYEVSMLYNNLTKKRGCQGCFNNQLKKSKSKDLSYFMEKSIEKHGFRYDYSKVIYNRCREPVEIICKEHGTFWQSPDNHYNKGKGCRKCRDKANRYVSFHKSRVWERKDEYLNVPSGVYIMEVGKYIKLGLSVNPVKRSKEIKNHSGLPIKILYTKSMSLYDSFMLEHKLHKHFKDFHPEVIEDFQGHTECFTLTDEQVNEAILIIDNYTIEGYK